MSDPTTIQESSLDNATGAELLRVGALGRFSSAVAGAVYSASLMTDELFADPSAYQQQQGMPSDQQLLDRRESVLYEQGGFFDDGGYSGWQQLRRVVTTAIPKLRAYAPTGAAEAHVGEMLALRGLADVHLAEDFCPGVPLHEVVEGRAVLSGPLTTDSVLRRALADFDSAAAYGSDSARVLNLALVGQGRALVGLGRFQEAATAVTGVPTDYSYRAEYLSGVFDNYFTLLTTAKYAGVANREGDNGLDFVSAGDPRVVVDSMGLAYDNVTVMYRPRKYADRSALITVASGIEARLIEAEAALNTGQGDWLAILNDLRATQVTPALPSLADPGSPAARVDLLFRERAFWLFGTGHRLGDLRRLIARYSRDPNSVFPVGAYRLGAAYGTATSIPFPARLETPYNPAVTGCTSR